MIEFIRDLITSALAENWAQKDFYFSGYFSNVFFSLETIFLLNLLGLKTSTCSPKPKISRSNSKFHMTSIEKIVPSSLCQLWNSRLGNSSIEKSWIAYKKIAPNAKLYLFDLAGYGNIPLNVQGNHVCLIAGWSDKVFDVLLSIEKGESAVEKIKQVVI